MISSGHIIILLTAVLTPVHQRSIYLQPNDSTWSTWCLEKDCNILEALIHTEIIGELSNTTFLLLPGTHTIRSNTSKLVSITLTTNFTLRAANLTEGATINCSGNVGFMFTEVSNVEISGITFGQCGTSSYLKTKNTEETFTLFFKYPCNVAINAVSIKNGKGTGLLVQNVCGYFTLSQAVLIMNNKNLNIFIEEATNNASIEITDSVFAYGHLITLFSSGIIIRSHILNIYDYVHVKLTNISTYQNINCSECNNNNMYIEIDQCRTSLVIENYISTYDSHVSQSKESNYSNTGLKLGLFTSTSDCKSELFPFIMNDADFNRSGIYIVWLMKKSEPTDSESSITFSNVNIESANIAIEVNDMTELGETITFNNISVKNSYYSGCVFFSSEITIKDSFTFVMNRGGIILFDSSLIIDESHVNISHNIEKSTAVLYAEDSAIKVFDNSNITFNDNRGGFSGAIYLIRESHIFVSGNLSMIMSDNRGKNGGAMALLQDSYMEFWDGSANLYFINNHASNVGGAVYADSMLHNYYTYENDYWPHSPACMNALYFLYTDENIHPTLHFKHNTAVVAGSAMYGVWSPTYMQYFHFDDSYEDDLSIVSSDPLQICMCIQSKPNCSIINTTAQLFPGQIFEMEAVAVGKVNGTVPAHVNALFVQPSTGDLNLTEYVQSIGKHCSKLTFTMRSSQQAEVLQLSIASPYYTFSCSEHIHEKQSFDIFFEIYSCPIGFIYNNTAKQCQCLETLVENGIYCDFNEMKVIRIKSKWINGWKSTINTNDTYGIIIHSHCPFDYCYFAKDTRLLDLLYPDEQCSYNRSGILCGACQAGFSHVLGTSKCKLCTTPWIILIIPLVAIAGILLVAGLTSLNLTVTMGTINGLIFYANIVKANHAALFPIQESSSFLSTFIAWVNLDLGIEICFYNGLDAYTKTWFQFLFPLYVWFMVIIIIVASHYSTRVSKVMGNDTIKVLATLFLLSYAKLLDTIITIFTSTVIVYPDGRHNKVWLYDGNINYCKGKHIALFIAAVMILVFLSIPYTAALLFIQKLQKFSHYKLLLFVGKLMPLFDAYTGPYKIKHRYWTGLLLLIRVCLFLIYSINTFGDPMINLLATSVTMFCLFAYLSMIGGVYKVWWHNLIEVAFILNLGIFPTAVLYQTTTNSTVESITNTSTSIAFVLFIMIVIFHIVKMIASSRVVGAIIKSKMKRERENEQSDSIGLNKEKAKITTTTIELWEPLMDSH